MIQRIFNQVLIWTAPLLPMSLIQLIAGRYVAGDNYKDALKIVEKLNHNGYSITIDILGEHSKTESISTEITNKYIDLFKSINSKKLDCNISVKPTHLGLDINYECAEKNLLSLSNTAKEYNNFLRIDMESSDVTDRTIQLYKRCKKNYSKSGTVIQAYLHRSIEDLKKLKSDTSFNFRLCKGIYRESSDIAIQNRKDINKNYLHLLEYAFKHDLYVGIATHDLDIIKATYKLIDKYQIKPERFEFQVLYGVPISGWLEKHLKNGYKVRVYVPFGPEWYDYSIRRLKENPNIAGYIISNFFKK